MKHIEVLDTTLRDGAQSAQVTFSLKDKLSILALLDDLGVEYAECGNPGANDADMELQELIGEFNLARQNVALEMSKSKEEQNKEKLDTQNKEMQRLYTLVMQNEHMADFTMAKADMDKLLHEINGIIALCCDGEDPDTCEVRRRMLRLMLDLRRMPLIALTEWH